MLAPGTRPAGLGERSGGDAAPPPPGHVVLSSFMQSGHVCCRMLTLSGAVGRRHPHLQERSRPGSGDSALASGRRTRDHRGVALLGPWRVETPRVRFRQSWDGNWDAV